jgi:hypothetical protein
MLSRPEFLALLAAMDAASRVTDAAPTFFATAVSTA